MIDDFPEVSLRGRRVGELDRRPHGLDPVRRAGGFQLRDVRRRGRRQGPFGGRLTGFHHEAVEAGGNGGGQGPRCLLAIDGVAVGDAADAGGADGGCH